MPLLFLAGMQVRPGAFLERSGLTRATTTPDTISAAATLNLSHRVRFVSAGILVEARHVKLYGPTRSVSAKLVGWQARAS